MRTLFSFVVLFGISALAILFIACGSADGASSQTQESLSDSSTSAEKAEKQVVHVSIADMQFSPETITVRAGTALTWTNDESVPHTATAGDESWDSDLLKEGESYTLTFDTPGTYCYYCVLHPGHNGNPCADAGVMSPLQADLVSLGGGGVPMKGTIVVTE
jgi:plastocyanin